MTFIIISIFLWLVTFTLLYVIFKRLDWLHGELREADTSWLADNLRVESEKIIMILRHLKIKIVNKYPALDIEKENK